MNKKIKIMVITIIFSLLVSATATVFATSNSASSILNSISPKTNSNSANSVTNATNTILGIVQIIGIAAAVIMLIVLAIKYVTAAPSEKADIKKSAIIYVVGAILLFATTGVLGIIKEFSKDLTSFDNTAGITGSPGGSMIRRSTHY